eukprot:TRINITY_DN2294_c1_g1_i2.p3 TRINITY_DN2294_c1_g1~~TRINITY_DN2294_c1_g1_i2.p3  ORF type:complete len:149 (+),score=13.91 TRINITY_DN2294_c1_g1_i2:2750-3196(+)
MKKIIVILFVITGLAVNAQNTKYEVLKEFLKGTISFNESDMDLGQPIASINTLAAGQADKVVDLSKDNIESTLEAAKAYDSVIITVGNHTIVKVTDLNNCSPSGAWGAKMPMATGYVQKAGVLNEKNDYIKNIIGRPDSQVRKVYLFN